MGIEKQENVYIGLINECHKIIEEIAFRTESIRRLDDVLVDKKVGTPSRSQLERELQGLRDHLLDIKESIVCY